MARGDATSAHTTSGIWSLVAHYASRTVAWEDATDPGFLSPAPLPAHATLRTPAPPPVGTWAGAG